MEESLIPVLQKPDCAVVIRTLLLDVLWRRARAYRNTECREVGDCYFLPEQGSALGSRNNETSYFERLEIQVVLQGMSTNTMRSAGIADAR